MNRAAESGAEPTLAAAPPFWALVPARLASTRLPDKPLTDIGGLPMVVRVARRAAASGAAQVVVCADSTRIIEACQAHGVRAILTHEHHPTGTDRLAEACALLHLPPQTLVVNVQGDEPLIPPSVIRQVAHALAADPQCDLATAAHPIAHSSEFFDPNVVKLVLDAQGRALLFSRAPLPWSRDAWSGGTQAALHEPLPAGLPALRHVGLYAYRAGFLLRFPGLFRPPLEAHENLEQLRALYHGSRIAVVQLPGALPGGVDTPADLERVRHTLHSAGADHGGGHALHPPAEDRP